MPITAAEYKEASGEVLRAAENAHQSGDYVASHYLCGLAVECMLRALRWRHNRAWEGRHYLKALAEEAKYFDLISNRYRPRFVTQFNDLTRRWNNEHRFYPAEKLEAHLIKLNVGSKSSDRLFVNSAEMVEFAHDLVGIGVAKW
ncbi:MAG TPA: hypothetical protein VGL56_13825 [Fimbriimonadaceae bacterium]|jgi:HEPN domain-containing protein